MVWGFQARFWVGSIDAIAESDRCWASSMTSRAIFLDASQRAAFSRAEEDARPVAEAYFLLAGGQGYAVVGVNETAHFGAQDDRAQAFERVLDDAEVLGRPHDAHAGVRAARWIATQPMS